MQWKTIRLKSFARVEQKYDDDKVCKPRFSNKDRNNGI